MDTKRTKFASEWFYTNVFQDEAITPRKEPVPDRLPSLLRTARSLEIPSGRIWQPREAVFYKQAKLLAEYEDDYIYHHPVFCYYPTYQSLSDSELRGYFGWRTRLRRGDVQKTSLSYAFLYIYELINGIGFSDPMEGYRKLEAFREAYGVLDEKVLFYLDRWMTDYVVYHGLDSSLRSHTPEVIFDRSVNILENMFSEPDDAVVEAVKALSPRWLDRSKFYRDHTADFDRVLVRVLRQISQRCDKRCKHSFTDQYFGPYDMLNARLFESAVFFDRMKDRSCAYALDQVRIYHCHKGIWTVQKYVCPVLPSAKLGDLVKTIDALMRQRMNYGKPIRCPLDTKWLLKLIGEEIDVLLKSKEEAQARHIHIDYSQLERIRRDAAVTREKLIVDEEEEEEIQPPIPEAPTTPPAANSPDIPLNETEYRLLQCLLYGQDLSWVQSSGLMLSVLTDSINEALYDTFADSVLLFEDGPELIEDYIDDLKEMVHP